MNELAAADRDFLTRVQQAIFANPFGAERRHIDRSIMGQDQGGTDLQQREAILTQRVEARLQALAKGDRQQGQYHKADKVLVDYAILFSIYHRYCLAFDELIASQVKSGDDSCAVPFAADCLGLMQEKGIAPRQAERYFALFFQMRRAFYFINQIVGNSSSVKELRRSLWNNVFTHDIGLYDQYLWQRMEDFSTLILGDTGTGKGMAAAAIGRSGYIPYDSRKGVFKESFTRAFVAINLAQFPEQLLDSELFGHKKGAFTGAIAHHRGILELCSPHGAIFLDEIGEVTVPVQIKLLKVLEERVFTPVGGHESKRFPGRIIAATNRPLPSLRDSADFRDDFYYRLCSGIITVPSLRQRLDEDPAELQVLVNHCLSRITGRPSPELAEMVERTMKKTLPDHYQWPGNVRELEQATRSILLSQSYHGLEPGRGEGGSPLAHLVDEGSLDAQSLLSRYCAQLFERHGTYEEVARITRLDRRTVKKHLNRAF